MYSPTHIQVTVQKARGLLTKGKNGTNNCFVTIACGKEKYQTSVKEKAEQNVSWNEECELKIPDQGNRAELTLTCLHRNNLAIDEFLGQVTLPLNEMDVYDRPRSKWYKLESKPGKEKKNKERGELEVRISFIVKSGSLTDLSKKDKHKSSIGQLASSVGGSLLSIGTIEKRKGIKKFAKSIGSKMHLSSKKKHKEGDDSSSFSGSFASIGTPNSSQGGNRHRGGQRAGEADPGVISEDEDEFVFENLSPKSSASSLNIRGNNHNHNHLQASSTLNYLPKNPSPLLANDKLRGKKLPPNYQEDGDVIVDPEIERIEHDFSVRARTLPPPSKPPRTPQLDKHNSDSNGRLDRTLEEDEMEATSASKEKTTKLDEWEKKLYGNHLDIGSTDSLKRRSWGPSLVPLPATAAAANENDKPSNIAESHESFEKSSSDSDSEDSEQSEQTPRAEEPKVEPVVVEREKPKETTPEPLNDFAKLNSSFMKIEKNLIENPFSDLEHIQMKTNDFIQKEAEEVPQKPKALPRVRPLPAVSNEENHNKQTLEETFNQKNRNETVEVPLSTNKDEIEIPLQADVQAKVKEVDDAERRRAAKRLEEDQKILNFIKGRSISSEDDSVSPSKGSPTLNASKRSSSYKETQSPKLQNELQQQIEQQQQQLDLSDDNGREKRVKKFKYFNNKREQLENNSFSPGGLRPNDRVIVGSERRSELTAALVKKYEGKTREELMLIANGMENEALIQRQRVKELEDYLDNLLLRVMETQPKLLQNPYSRTKSAKSG